MVQGGKQAVHRFSTLDQDPLRGSRGRGRLEYWRGRIRLERDKELIDRILGAPVVAVSALRCEPEGRKIDLEEALGLPLAGAQEAMKQLRGVLAALRVGIWPHRDVETVERSEHIV